MMTPVYRSYTGVVQTIPVTARFEPDKVQALDLAIAAGLATSRSAVIHEAVSEWLRAHSSESIAASYRRAYAAEPNSSDDDDLALAISSFGVAACLADGN